MDQLRWGGDVRKVRDAAAKAARDRGHGQVRGSHLLLGLLEVRSAAGEALAQHEVGPERLGRAVDETYDGAPLVEGHTVDASGPELRDVLENAQDLADADGAFEVAPAHLFLAATEDPRWSAYRALKAAGLDPAAIRQDVERLARDEAQGSL
jgi:ATP-dependent Clp protease ATP-binding subunit ClpA